jgi:acyl-CoA synthetase (NDP forming)
VGAVAIVGGSSNSFWTTHAVSNLGRFGYPGEIAIVNKRPSTISGLSTYRSLDEIGPDVDAALVAVSSANANAVVRALGARCCPDVVVITDGYSERNEAGREKEQRLVEAAHEVERMYGPNCVGFADFRRGLTLIAEPIPERVTVGSVSVVSQSGAVLAAVLAALTRDGVGIDWACSIGNAAKFDLTTAIDHIVSRGTTRTICAYAESLGNDPQRLAGALDRCTAAGVSIIALTPGRSIRTRAVALSHTGSVVGEYEHIRAFAEQHGVYLVDTLSELARVAALLDVTSPLGVESIFTGVVGSSGGSAILASDAMERHGVELPSTTTETLENIAPLVAEGSYLHNPMDIVGKPGQKEAIETIYQLAFGDDKFNLIMHPWPVPYPDDTDGMRTHRNTWERIARTAGVVGKPTVLSSVVEFPQTEWVTAFQQHNPGVRVLPDLELTATALGVMTARQRDFDDPADQTIGRFGPLPPVSTDSELVMVGEAEGRELLRPHGLPLVRGISTREVDAVESTCADLVPPFVVKVAGSGMTHKASAGLVHMNICSCSEAARIARSMVESAGLAPGTFEVLVQETFLGEEILCSWSRNVHGILLTLGPGGTGPTDHNQYRTVALPISLRRLSAILRRLMLVADGAPMDALLNIVTTVSDLYACDLASSYHLLELNPVIVSKAGAQIVDVLLHRSIAEHRIDVGEPPNPS